MLDCEVAESALAGATSESSILAFSGAGGSGDKGAELVESPDGAGARRASAAASVEGLELGWLMTKTIWGSQGVPQDPMVPSSEPEPASREEEPRDREGYRSTGDCPGLAN